jgi:hypothetical protein
MTASNAQILAVANRSVLHRYARVGTRASRPIMNRRSLPIAAKDSPEGPSFPQHAAVDHSRQAGSDRTLTMRGDAEPTKSVWQKSTPGELSAK